MRLTERLRSHRTDILIVALVSILVAGTLIVFDLLKDKSYRAHAEIAVLPGYEIADPYAALLASQNLVPTYDRLLTSDPVLNRVINELGLPDDTDGLRARIGTQPVPNTLIIRIAVDDDDPQRAARIATGIGEVFSSYLQVPVSDSTDGVDLTSPVQVTVAAQVPNRLVGPSRAVVVLAGLGVGLLTGIALVGFRTVMRPRKSEDAARAR